MVTLPDVTGKRKLVAQTRRYLSSLGWQVTDANSLQVDLYAKKRDFLFRLHCIDRGVLNFLPPEEILKRLQSEFFIEGINGIPVAITNFEFDNNLSGRITSSGLLIVPVSDLLTIGKMDLLQDELPGVLTDRQLSLCRRNTSVCLSIADRFRERGDVTNAIKWIELAISGNTRSLAARLRLLWIYQEVGSLTAMKDVATAALDIDPTALIFLRVLMNLAVREGDAAETKMWKMKIAKAEQAETNQPKLPTFESIIDKHKASAPSQTEGLLLARRKSTVRETLLRIYCRFANRISGQSYGD